MKTEAAIKRRLRQRQFRHLSRYIETFLAKKHYNCKHNALVASGPSSLHVCTCPELSSEQWMKDVVPIGRLNATRMKRSLHPCDTRVKGSDVSATCLHFETMKTKEQLQEDFKDEVASVVGDSQEFARVWPDVSQLLWVLGNPNAQDVHVGPPAIEAKLPDDKELEITPEEMKSSKLSFWWLPVLLSSLSSIG